MRIKILFLFLFSFNAIYGQIITSPDTNFCDQQPYTLYAISATQSSMATWT